MKFLASPLIIASALTSIFASSLPASQTTFETKVTQARDVTRAAAADGQFLSGCDNPKLWSQSIACPDKNAHGACRNPHQDLEDWQIKYAHEWFKACQGRAYTFPKDDTANSNGKCQSGIVNCQILPKESTT
ncbi:hypothetical protein QC762_306157 [Podospora pseudocomata]|uniref:Uncharacterized protein n=1 Tax=Podospora pseudocomata TaxID=2093779 RepID=A0ABR0GJF4_9PEZI|nr:hypothetical protein QC762_306157 [Podospora pseudocomata]